MAPWAPVHQPHQLLPGRDLCLVQDLIWFQNVFAPLTTLEASWHGVAASAQTEAPFESIGGQQILVQCRIEQVYHICLSTHRAEMHSCTGARS